MEDRIIVLGAGVAGLAAALPLARAGRTVTVIDPLPPAGGSSFGNAGLLSPDTSVPVALPGMLRKVPGWLSDPMGPLVVRPGYFPRALPWLLRWIRAGRMDRALVLSQSMRALHGASFAHWRDLLGPDGFAEFIRRNGQVQVWDQAEETPAAALERSFRARQGIPTEVLGAPELREMFPGIAARISRGVLIPGNGHTVNPGRMVRRLAELFLAAGGEIRAERALKLIPREGARWMVMTNIANHETGTLVVAGGAWSGSLIAPLGLRLPLETERGYHLFLPDANITPDAPLLYKSRSFSLTPMEGGLRAAGTVEIAGLDAVPDERRAERLLAHVRTLFPAIEGGTPRLWMGHRPSTPDSLPVLGPAPGHPGLHLCLGHGHFGMTGGPPSGRLVADLILGATPRIDAAPYSARRFL
ncbi:NAD(P)/FAD-dependent oxidoreductase [Roseococcus sp.]|uniref:NAD(P)/FAD-dependent oxidoreductase n=1 Tax=Roseococcus sp. TaxID=2109646 RepID=UPI003BA8FF47